VFQRGVVSKEAGVDPNFEKVMSFVVCKFPRIIGVKKLFSL
jgi:hypothetical protein